MHPFPVYPSLLPSLFILILPPNQAVSLLYFRWASFLEPAILQGLEIYEPSPSCLIKSPPLSNPKSNIAHRTLGILALLVPWGSWASTTSPTWPFVLSSSILVLSGLVSPSMLESYGSSQPCFFGPGLLTLSGSFPHGSGPSLVLAPGSVSLHISSPFLVPSCLLTALTTQPLRGSRDLLSVCLING